MSDYGSTSYWIEKSTTKAIALVAEKIEYMLLQRQIVVKGLGKQIDTEDLICIKYAGTSFQIIIWMLISVIVTINRNASLERYETSHCLTTAKLRSCI
jgi:hypothetical protein